MTPSEKKKIIEDSYEAIKDLYILRNELLTDAGNLEAAKESNRKLSDMVANLEVTIKALNSAIDKKDAEINIVKNSRDTIFDNYLGLCHKCHADEEIKKHMMADNRKKKDEIKRLKEELEAEKKSHCCDGCGSIAKVQALKRICVEENHKIEKYKSEIAELETNFHELRERIRKLGLWYIHDALEPKDVKAFTDWFTEAFGDFGINDEEE